MDQTTINQAVVSQTTDWLMVAITAVYVLATIAICYFNAKSAKASREQLAESKRQFDAINSPNIVVEIKIIHNEMWVLRFTNLGTQPAFDLNISIADDFISVIREQHLKDIIKQNNRKRLVLYGGSTYDIYYGTKKNPFNNDTPIKGIISFKDSCGRQHSDDFQINAQDYAIVAHMDSETDLLLKEMKEQTKAINTLCSLISCLKTEKNTTEQNDIIGEE